LLEQRGRFNAGSTAAEAGAALARHLIGVLLELEPELVGAYWPYRSEFNAVTVLEAHPTLAKLPMALPFAQRATLEAPLRMQYRAWDGIPNQVIDEVGIVSGNGAMVVPDVAIVPCVGFTRGGYRLGYGAGFFDRYLAQHPQITTIGVAWAFSEIDDEVLGPQPHDVPMTLIVTELGVV
jgi:5-formyltetrahydrofolate cyclo-ligase